MGRLESLGRFEEEIEERGRGEREGEKNMTGILFLATKK